MSDETERTLESAVIQSVSGPTEPEPRPDLDQAANMELTVVQRRFRLIGQLFRLTPLPDHSQDQLPL